jgi:hypothetical protein
MGGGRKRIDAAVEVAQRAKLGLEEDALARGLRAVQFNGSVAEEGLELLPIFVEPVQQRFPRERLRPIYAGENQVFPFQQFERMLAQLRGIQQLPREQRFLLGLVRVKGCDSLLG